MVTLSCSCHSVGATSARLISYRGVAAVSSRTSPVSHVTAVGSPATGCLSATAQVELFTSGIGNFGLDGFTTSCTDRRLGGAMAATSADLLTPLATCSREVIKEAAFA